MHTLFLRKKFNHCSPTLQPCKWCGATTKNCRSEGGKVEKTMLVKYLNFVKSTNWKECFIPFSFFTQSPAQKRSISEVESSSPEAQPEDCRAAVWNSS